ncbi:MAG: NAD-dependent epimerase/dehydratase family protein [Anaerolineae bacterium]|jgi:nucleoside-diphosphate-sugar epimerase|nr:NAD-dependent epimerase/dehydratase family protein [Anaerolineae bacterium]
MRILVIGGTQFIGLALVNQLYQMGHEVAVFHRGQSNHTLPDGVITILGDMNHLTDYRAEFAKFAPDVVLHNMVLTENQANQLVDTCKGLVKRVVMTSSMDVYQDFGRVLGLEDSPIQTDILTEESPLRTGRYPRRSMAGDDTNHIFYNYDKIPCEEIILNTPDIQGTVLRLPMVFGERDKQRRLYTWVHLMKKGSHMIFMDETQAMWRSTYGYVENVAQAMALTCVDERASGQIYNIADGIFDTLGMAYKVKAVMKWDGRFAVKLGLPEALRFGAVPQSLQVSSEKIERHLGFVRKISFDEGIARTVAWDLANPLDPLPESLIAIEQAQQQALDEIDLY